MVSHRFVSLSIRHIPNEYAYWTNDFLKSPPGFGNNAIKCFPLFVSTRFSYGWIDISHKSHNVPVPYSTMYHFVTEIYTCVDISVTKWCIVRYLSNVLWDLWDEYFYIASVISLICRGSTGKVTMTSNGNIFRVSGPLCGEFTGLRWIPRTKASDAELWCFLWSAPN